MCQSRANGGHRCPPTPTGKALRRLRAKGDTSGVEKLLEAKGVYGSIVSPLDVPVPAPVEKLLTTLRQSGNPLLVGGTIRDAIMGAEPKDFDVEVHGTDMDTLVRDLRKAGYRVDEVGKAFGVLKVRAGNDDIDVSVPRRDSLSGAGHRGFEVEVDGTMGVKEAAERRDFTFNAMMYDPARKVCIDPYNGRQDLNDRVLAHVSDAFGEDPLRPMRAFQFAGRYDMTLNPETAQVCRDLRERADELPVERLRGEWGKFYSKATTPSASVAVLKEMGWDDTVPGIHTVDTVAIDRVAKSGPVLLGAVMTKNMNDQDSREFFRRTVEGDDYARRGYLLSRTNPPSELSRAEVRRWARDLGRKGLSVKDWEARETAFGNSTDHVSSVARNLGVYDTPPTDLIQGRDILPLTNRAPGPWMGQLLSVATKAQDEGAFNSREEALAWLSSRAEISDT